MESFPTIPRADRVDAKLSRVVSWLAMPVGSQTVCRSVGFYPWEMTVPAVSVANPISRRPATLVRSLFASGVKRPDLTSQACLASMGAADDERDSDP